ncbi:MAG: hypothetical protein E4H41_10625 [Gemmatimonadales bacterium]|nr:MAG: hypothetical protein E4H41_10625 [Gemmatimonadales bacterium]
MSTVSHPAHNPSQLWRVAQVTGLLLTVVLLVGLLRMPTLALHVLWDMVIPLLPAVFLINPMLWRNVCPLATLNQFREPSPATRLPPNALQGGWIAGMILLFALVPARRFLFNEQGAALAVTIVVVALLALGSGFLYSRRAGFCNSLCPVLPVEKLYGQAPLVQVSSAICPDCTACAVRGCIDLAGGQALAQSVGKGLLHDARWLVTPAGAFALLFPGFVVGYFTTVNGGLDTALAVYAHIGLWMLLGAIALGVVATILRVPGTLALPLIGAGALALYYWYAGPALATAYGVESLGPVVFRGAFFLLIGVWLARTIPTLRRAS